MTRKIKYCWCLKRIGSKIVKAIVEARSRDVTAQFLKPQLFVIHQNSINIMDVY